MMDYIVQGVISLVGIGLTGAFCLWTLSRADAKQNGDTRERLARIECKFDNGVNVTMARLERHIGEIFAKLDNRPCERHELLLLEISRRLNAEE